MNKILLTSTLFTILLNSSLFSKVIITAGASKLLGNEDQRLKDTQVQFSTGIQGYMSDSTALSLKFDTSSLNDMPDGGKTDLERLSLNLHYDFMHHHLVERVLRKIQILIKP